MPRRVISIGPNGGRIGESHANAKLTDHDVDLIRELATERDEHGRVVKPGLSYRVLARKFEVSKGCIQKIVQCLRRAQVAVRTVSVSEPSGAAEALSAPARIGRLLTGGGVSVKRR